MSLLKTDHLTPKHFPKEENLTVYRGFCDIYEPLFVWNSQGLNLLFTAHYGHLKINMVQYRLFISAQITLRPLI